MSGKNRRRKSITITLGREAYEILKKMQDIVYFENEDGSKTPYPASYLIEDLLLWVSDDEKRFLQFLDDNYTPDSKEEVKNESEGGIDIEI